MYPIPHPGTSHLVYTAQGLTRGQGRGKWGGEGSLQTQQGTWDHTCAWVSWAHRAGVVVGAIRRSLPQLIWLESASWDVAR